ncbi:U32 family peptidase [Halopseudomonas salina]|uniref:Ubiquinone biosynthesis protein UbiV n=1 Tax=Halopseudomonas salina TaxID=1323744 RepID=A0ABQ1PJI2_9GAMM|nr:U32 family peptidase [Halopseudomonas salina]GGC98306.1 U32 family peptidase [Halopseudomonas salina]
MKLSMGPILFYWQRQEIMDFYASMASQPLDAIYLGETVCSKRRALSLDDWLGLARDLRSESDAEVVISGMALIEAASELSTLRRLCENGDVRVEANDMAAVQYLRQRGVEFTGGPSLNLYNAYALDEMVRLGMTRWVPPVEVSEALLRNLVGQARKEGLQIPEIEIYAWGYLPLAYSARCFTARADNRPKDDCGFICQDYPEGLPLLSQEGQPLFTLNGIQTMSAGITNLLAEYPRMNVMGVDMLRISPAARDMEAVVRSFDQVRQGAEPPLAIDGCNGYWYGEPGMLRVEEAGLC